MPQTPLKSAQDALGEEISPKPTKHLIPKSLSSVRKAREVLKEQAHEILQEFRATIKEARASGKYEEALGAYKWLLEHTPGDDGERLLEMTVDKVKEKEDKPTGPLIQLVGISLGGIKTLEAKATQSLPDIIIDAVDGETL